MRRAVLVISFLALCVGSVAHANDAILRTGQPVLGPVGTQCDATFILDNADRLCTLFPGAYCPSTVKQCRDYERQVFAGTLLGQTVQNGQQWNGMGGSGELIADSVMCALRDLSPALRGPIRSEIRFNLGIGDIVAAQEIGLIDFARVNPVFTGYRRITFDMPVVGRAESVTQDIVVTKRTYGHMGTRPLAGDQEIVESFGLNVATEAKTLNMLIQLPGFPVTTPIGTFTVTPDFTYGTSASVIAAPFATTYSELPNFLGRGRTVRYVDIYGLDQGLAHTAKPVIYQNMGQHRTGWLSQLGLGTRGTVANRRVWQAPSSGPAMRPDIDPSQSRSSAEAEPSIGVTARAVVRYPQSVREILPAWVFNIPFPLEFDAYIEVAPTVEAGVGGQFVIGAGEGSDHWENQEFRFMSDRFAASVLATGLNVAASFRVDVRLRLWVRVRFPWPIGGKNLVNVDKTIPVPLFGDQKSAPAIVAGAWSTGHDAPEGIDYMKTMHGVELRGPFEANTYIQQCYAPGPTVAAAPPQPTPPAPGNPEDLFSPEDIMWPCNICMHTIGQDYDGKSDPEWPNPHYVEPRVEWLLPATTPATWPCDAPAKSGCMDMCRYDPATDRLTVVRRPGQVASSLPAGHPEKDFYAFCEQPWPTVR